MQELEVVQRMNLPIHYFVFDNAGYGSIASMQDSRFGLRVGATKESGFTVPALGNVARCFDIAYGEILVNEKLSMKYSIRNALEINEPTITRVVTSLDFRYANRVQSTLVNNILVPDRMEDVSPKLDPEELERLMR
jgi:acetolactate synthase-1/2/3 large subunit